jgi:predicted ATPase
LFSVLFGFWIPNFVAFNGEVARELAAQFLALAERQGATGPLMIGHQMMGNSLAATGDFAEGRAHYDQAFVLYDPAVHRPLAMRFSGADWRVGVLSFRSLTLWMLGYPEAALADAEQALENAREIGHAATLMLALFWAGLTKMSCRNYAAAKALEEELVALADQQGSPTWKVAGTLMQGCVSALTGKAADAIQMISGLTASRSLNETLLEPFILLSLALAHAGIGQIGDAWRSIDEALTRIEKAKKRWHEAEVNRVAGELARLSPEPDAANAEAYFERALAVARQQQAKSWELRAAMSMARLWRDQGKRDEGRELLAPVYGWFTEGFDTRDLKEARALLDELVD